MSWKDIDEFLGDIAKECGYAREELSLVAELRTAGPTVHPGPAQEGQIEKTVVANEKTSLPSASYDSIGSKHIEYRVLRTVGTEKVKIPHVLYSWQLHPLPGNCGICINRWVQMLDTTKPWSVELQRKALRFRAALARSYSYGILLVSTGNSFKGGELLDQFQTIYTGLGRGPVTIAVLDLREFLK